MWKSSTIEQGTRAGCRGLLLLAVGWCIGAQAQMGPGGGGPPGGMGQGMAPGGKGPSAAAPAERPRMPTLDDLVPPDPLRIWLDRLERLELGAPGLVLTESQVPAFRAFVRELHEAVQLNAQRLQRQMRRMPPSVSASVDVGRDLRQEADEARDWINALDDLRSRWEALCAVLSPGQRTMMDGIYRSSRDTALQWAHKPPSGM
jgi:hypothetical protein